MSTAAYYNDNDPFMADWLENLIECGLIAYGAVDRRPIQDVAASDLDGFIQCHFFAGIGGWSWALRLANWPDDRPVWTGSCPCQPFSKAGSMKGKNDSRHLWPYWYCLIAQCSPTIVFGEQVTSPLGRSWLDSVSSDLENLGYAVGAADLCAASVGALHKRQRLYLVADSSSMQCHSGKDHGVCLQHEMAVLPEPRNGCAAANDRAVHWGVDQSIPFTIPNDVSGRVGRLRGYGNAIVPDLAAEFIVAYMDCVRRLP